MIQVHLVGDAGHAALGKKYFRRRVDQMKEILPTHRRRNHLIIVGDPVAEIFSGGENEPGTF